jgi:hypothetical protein
LFGGEAEGAMKDLIFVMSGTDGAQSYVNIYLLTLRMTKDDQNLAGSFTEGWTSSVSC